MMMKVEQTFISCYHEDKFHLQMSPSLFNNLQRPSKDHIKTHKILPLPHIKAWSEEANYSHEIVPTF